MISLDSIQGFGSVERWNAL